MKLILLLSFLSLCTIAIAQVDYGRDPSPLPLSTNSIQEEPTENPTQLYQFAWYAPEEIGRAKHYEKLEIGMAVPRNVKTRFYHFLDNNPNTENGLNPYNRHDFQCIMRFYKDDSLVDQCEGFYYVPQKVVQTHMIDDTTSFPIRFRHAPRFTGLYKATVEIKIEEQSVYVAEFDFVVISSGNEGYLEKGKHDYHLRLAKSKRSFFGVGQCIPWTDWPNGNNFKVKANFKQLKTELGSYFETLNEAGGNFSRIVGTDWSLQFEIDALGNYQSRRDQAWYLDKLADYCSDNEIYFMYCMRVQHEFFSEKHTVEAMDVYNKSGWKHCVYNADSPRSKYAEEPRPDIHTPEEFFSHPEAKDHYKNFLRYVVSRYGYSSSIAAWQLMSEINDIGGYGHYLGDTVSAQRKVMHQWIDEMAAYLDTTLMDRHLTSIAIVGDAARQTVCAADDISIYGSPYIDLTGIHTYTFQTADPSKHQKGQNGGIFRNRNVLTVWEAVRNFTMGTNGDRSIREIPEDFGRKPFIFDEYGTVAHDVIGGKLNTTIQFEKHTPHKFHYDLWSSSCSGSATTGLDWWISNEVERHEMWKQEFNGIRNFFENIDFESNNYCQEHYDKSNGLYMAQRWPWTESEVRATDYSRQNRDYSNKDALEGFSMTTDDGEKAFGWIHNRSYYWYNLVDENDGLAEMINGTGPWSDTVLVQPMDDDKDTTFRPVQLNKDYIVIRNMKRMKKYVIQYFDPLTNKELTNKVIRSSMGGKIKIAPPVIVEEHQDISYKLQRRKKTRHKDKRMTARGSI